MIFFKGILAFLPFLFSLSWAFLGEDFLVGFWPLIRNAPGVDENSWLLDKRNRWRLDKSNVNDSQTAFFQYSGPFQVENKPQLLLQNTPDRQTQAAVSYSPTNVAKRASIRQISFFVAYGKPCYYDAKNAPLLLLWNQLEPKESLRIVLNSTNFVGFQNCSTLSVDADEKLAFSSDNDAIRLKEPLGWQLLTFKIPRINIKNYLLLLYPQVSAIRTDHLSISCLSLHSHVLTKREIGALYCVCKYYGKCPITQGPMLAPAEPLGFWPLISEYWFEVEALSMAPVKANSLNSFGEQVFNISNLFERVPDAFGRLNMAFRISHDQDDPGLEWAQRFKITQLYNDRNYIGDFTFAFWIFANYTAENNRLFQLYSIRHKQAIFSVGLANNYDLRVWGPSHFQAYDLENVLANDSEPLHTFVILSYQRSKLQLHLHSSKGNMFAHYIRNGTINFPWQVDVFNYETELIIYSKSLFVLSCLQYYREAVINIFYSSLMNLRELCMQEVKEDKSYPIAGYPNYKEYLRRHGNLTFYPPWERPATTTRPTKYPTIATPSKMIENSSQLSSTFSTAAVGNDKKMTTKSIVTAVETTTPFVYIDFDEGYQQDLVKKYLDSVVVANFAIRPVMDWFFFFFFLFLSFYFSIK